MTKFVILAMLSSTAAAAATWTFPAGPPELSKSGGYAFPMDEEHYAKFIEQTKASGHSVAVIGKPANLTAAARYGYNFVVGGKNRGWILDGDDEHGWILYLDWKGDGDLSHAQAQKFERTDGVYRLQVEVAEGELRWPCRFQVAHVKDDGKEQLAVIISNTTVRKGVIELDGHQYPFSLSGTAGRYDSQYDHLAVNRFAAGQPDSYKATDRFLNLGGKSYEFAVDPLGGNLSLSELSEVRPDRPSLKVGSPAPDFSAPDLDGTVRSLASYRGRTVLVEFWATSCGPCRQEAPRMAELYGTLSRNQVEFLGVSSDTSEKTLREFLHDFKIPWPQLREPFEAAMHQAYRVAGEPTYFLIGPDGAIADTWMGSGETTERITKALKAQR